MNMLCKFSNNLTANKFFSAYGKSILGCVTTTVKYFTRAKSLLIECIVVERLMLKAELREDV